MITVDDVTKRFGAKLAVDHLGFDVREGVVTGFLGPNGSGKSTTMRCMLGLDRAESGTTLFAGRPYHSLRRPLHEVGALLDAGYVHPGRSGRNHLRWMAASNGIPTRRVDEVLELVGLTTVATTRVRKYSLGMRQRLGLAGVLLGEPHTVILDEPANGLDPEGIRWIRDVLTHLAGQGCAVLVSSHQLSEISLMADELIVIGQGRLIEQCTVTDFIERHADRWVRVRSPRADALASLLGAAGARVDTLDATGLDVHDVTCAQVGEVAAANGVVLHELSPQTGSLEDAFLKVTADALEYRSGARWGWHMINLMRSEWIKLRTVTMNWVLGLIALVFPLLVTLLTAFFHGDDTGDFDRLITTDLLGVLTGTAIVSALLCGVITAASITGEYGFGTIRPTFAATPRRLRVVVAKGAVAVGFAMVLATVVLLIGWFVGSAIANGHGADLHLEDADTAVPAMVGLVVLFASISLVGYALGMISRSTAAAVSILIVWPLIAEGLIGALIGLMLDNEHVGQWMPFQAGFRMVILEDIEGGPSRLAGGIYFAVFSAVLAAIGAWSVNRRDA